MLFNSPIFPLFFAVVYLGYLLLQRGVRRGERGGLMLAGQNLWLLLASYAFYAWWDWRFLLLLMGSTGVDYLCGRAMAGGPKRALVGLSVAVNLGILAVFKYLGWFVSETGALLEALGLAASTPTLELLLPVGLSFYTFQSMSYTIDVYRGRIQPERSLLTFALFVSFFPQLVAGPIERSERLMPQLASPRTLSRDALGEGAWWIVWGAFKKVFVADNLGVLVEKVYASEHPTSGFMVMVAAWAFTWQIYCDFSGYTDIARGVARMLGVELSPNFKLPFFASSPRELWHRWHISLSEWLRDYVYIPLGGSRRGPVRTQINLALTMLLGGLWHGANWTFVVWGAYHGLALAIQRVFRRPEGPAVSRWGQVLGALLTFQFTSLGFLIFRAKDMRQVGQLLWTLISDFRPWYGDYGDLALLGVLISVPLGVELVMRLRGDDLEWPLRWPRWVQALVVCGLVAATFVLGASYGERFIYFQF